MHNHDWHVASSHRTSQGPVRYLACSCGAYRIDLGAASVALTEPVPALELRA